jgi:WD40 repeat protein
LAAQDTEGNVCLWDVSSGKSRKLGPHASGVSAIAFSADGKAVASGGSNGTLKVWDRATGKVRRQFGGHSARVTAMAFAPDGRTLASGSADTTILLWDLLRNTPPTSP